MTMKQYKEMTLSLSKKNKDKDDTGRIPNKEEDSDEDPEKANETRVEKLHYSNFVIYFDQALYEAPPIIIKLEDDLAKNENEGAYQQ